VPQPLKDVISHSFRSGFELPQKHEQESDNLNCLFVAKVDFNAQFYHWN